MKRRTFLGLGAAVAAMIWLCGCLGPEAVKPRFTPSGGPLGGSDAAWTAIANGAKVRVAVYSDSGARGTGLLRWLQLAASSPDFTVRAVDGDMVRAGVLDDTDLLVMPGGYADDEAASLKKEGCAAVKAFVARGGSYVGTCAGCYLVLQNNEKAQYRLQMVPFKDVRHESHGQGTLKVDFLPGCEALGLKPGKRDVMYAHGPILLPGEPMTNAEFKVIANFFGDMAVDGPEALSPMSGKGAMVAGTYGKGRIWASSVHPEALNSTWDIARRMLAWGAHRNMSNVSFERIVHKRGNLAVGVVTDLSCGAEAGEIFMKLTRNPKFDVVPLNTSKIREGQLRQVDALVLADCVENKGLKKRYAKLAATLSEFAANGGEIIGWGEFAKTVAKAKIVKDGDAVLAELAKIAAAGGGGTPPLPGGSRSVATASTGKRVRAAVYLGGGGGSTGEARLLEQSPEYEVYYVNGPSIAEGALKGADILIQGGGSGEAQFKALGEKGQAQLREFILNGGGYHGTCAGAFLMIEPTRRVRMNMVPFRPDDPDHYRGGADTLLKATPAGKAVLGSNSLYRVCYHGGPVMLPGKPVEGADFKVFLEYYGNMINTESSKPMLPMTGKAAMVGGTCGKGKVVLCGPHPEVDESTDEIFLKTVGWITGTQPHPVRGWHRRGLPNVGCSSGRQTVEAGRLFARLLREPGINYYPGQSLVSDVQVLSSPDAGDFNSVTAYRLAPKGRLVILQSGDKNLPIPEHLKGAVICKTADEAYAAVRGILEKIR